MLSPEGFANLVRKRRIEIIGHVNSAPEAPRLPWLYLDPDELRDRPPTPRDHDLLTFGDTVDKTGQVRLLDVDDSHGQYLLFHCIRRQEGAVTSLGARPHELPPSLNHLRRRQEDHSLARTHRLDRPHERGIELAGVGLQVHH
ncbi:MAG: hypothetical protein QOF89_3303 [Acidobacteriota bacterium]|nr:hypothetical protein [Acidobacteriota bacterium]